MPVKKKPSVKQLRARAKFVKMVRARARAAKAAKRAASKRPVVRQRNWSLRKKTYRVGGGLGTVKARSKKGARKAWRKLTGNPSPSVTKNGRKLYGAAALAVLKSRGSKKRVNPKKRGVMLTSRKKPNGIFRSAIRSAVSKRLSAPVRFGRRKRNGNAPEPIEAMTQKFLGHPTDPAREMDVIAPQGTPRDVARLGDLVLLKTDTEEFAFEDGEAYLLADGRDNLYVGFASDADVNSIEPNTNFGHLEQVNYVAQKDHLNPRNRRHSRKKRRNGEPIEWFHHFGEEGGQLPKLQSDADGMLHIVGGSYTIEAEGITD